LLARALAALPNTVGWDDWNLIGMASWRATNGSAAGFALFDAWSQKSPKYDARATSAKWTAYFKSPPTHIGAGTIFHLANQHAPGWRDAPPDPEPQSDPEPSGDSLSDEMSHFGFSWTLRWHGKAPVADSRRWLVQDLLPETGVGLIAGQWGTYKTFIALDLAGSVMTGTDFIKFPVRRKGGVLFIACEGQNEVAIRLQAVVEACGLEDVPFVWVENCPRLLDPNASKILTSLVTHAKLRMLEELGIEVVLVIIDTAPRAAGYLKAGDENDAAVAKFIMKTLATASDETSTLFLAVAHFGKAVETGTRGSSAFEDDADVVLALLGNKGINGAVTNTRLCARKRRNGVNGEEFAFTTRIADMGVDENGAPLTTLIINWCAPDATIAPDTPKADAWSKSLRLLRQTLMNMLADCGKDIRPFSDGPIVRAVDIEALRGQFYRGYPAAEGVDAKGKSAARQKAFVRAIGQAKERGLIGTWEVEGTTYVWLAAPAQTQGGFAP
jgi:hypothetical protein